MSARLVYVMDPLCSWCWGFAPVAEALVRQAQDSGVQLHLVMGGLRANDAPLDPSTRRYILDHWQSVQQTTGQPFLFDAALPDGFVYDTTPVCRAVVTARQIDPQAAWRLVGLIQAAFYAEGRDVTQGALLAELAEQAGLDRLQFAELFDSAELKSATVADFAWVQGLGIAGFPTLLAERNGQLALLTNGYQPLDALAPLLGRWLERATSA